MYVATEISAFSNLPMLCRFMNPFSILFVSIWNSFRMPGIMWSLCVSSAIKPVLFVEVSHRDAVSLMPLA